MEREEQLLRALHDEHAPALWSFVCRINGGDRTWAQDVVQETMLRAWRHPEVLGQARGSARSWLFTVARRIVIDEWRSPRTSREVMGGDGLVALRGHELTAADAGDAVDAVLDAWLVAEALAALTVEHRSVLVECYYRGLSTAEAARTLQIPEGTVKSRTHYALRALRLALQEMGVTA